jgi:predicted ATP-grasp superfamily ATP-dependent carboligase
LIKKDNIAVVLGLYETGLGVGRSLGRKGINVIGLDFKKDIGFYSRYIKALLCPHPLKEEKQFVEFLLSIAKKQKEKIVLFITADDFLISISRNRKSLREYILMNISAENLIESIVDKYEQYKITHDAGVIVPKTFSPNNLDEVAKLKQELVYPVFVKAQEVTSWRDKIKGGRKGFFINNAQELMDIFKMVFEVEVKAIVQELIRGPDTNHFKICCYVSQQNEILLAFTLQKIRQCPIKFGVGSVVQSIYYPELLRVGKKLFRDINYRGVGSAEFKLDEKDGKLKLIEINPRYWQQNILADKCGVNFPLIDYLEVTGQKPRHIVDFSVGIKWINIHLDFKSYLSYKKLRELNAWEWLNSLRGKKIFSVLAWDDIIPEFYEMSLKRFIKLPRYIFHG